MEKPATLLALCEGNPPVTSRLPEIGQHGYKSGWMKVSLVGFNNWIRFMLSCNLIFTGLCLLLFLYENVACKTLRIAGVTLKCILYFICCLPLTPHAVTLWIGLNWAMLEAFFSPIVLSKVGGIIFFNKHQRLHFIWDEWACRSIRSPFY